MKKSLVALTVLAAFSSSVAHAEIIVYACKFTIQADNKGVKKELLTPQYIINTTTNKAHIAGNLGVEPVTVVPQENGMGLSIVEITATGNVMTTTISSGGDAVHSRNTILFGALIPGQHYGKCKKQA